MTQGRRWPLCSWCKRKRDENNAEGTATCDAFPHGIPDRLLLGADHRKPIEGDNGVRFEAVDPKDPNLLRAMKLYD